MLLLCFIMLDNVMLSCQGCAVVDIPMYGTMSVSYFTCFSMLMLRQKTLSRICQPVFFKGWGSCRIATFDIFWKREKFYWAYENESSWEAVWLDGRTVTYYSVNYTKKALVFIWIPYRGFHVFGINWYHLILHIIWQQYALKLHTSYMYWWQKVSIFI